MVNNIVVALINTSAVVAFKKRAANVFLGGIVLLRLVSYMARTFAENLIPLQLFVMEKLKLGIEKSMPSDFISKKPKQP